MAVASSACPSKQSTLQADLQVFHCEPCARRPLALSHAHMRLIRLGPQGRCPLISTPSWSPGRRSLRPRRVHTCVCGPALPCDALCAARGLRGLLRLHQPDGHAEVVWQGACAVAPQPAHPEQAQGQRGCASLCLPCARAQLSVQRGGRQWAAAPPLPPAPRTSTRARRVGPRSASRGVKPGTCTQLPVQWCGRRSSRLWLC